MKKLNFHSELVGSQQNTEQNTVSGTDITDIK